MDAADLLILAHVAGLTIGLVAIAVAFARRNRSDNK